MATSPSDITRPYFTRSKDKVVSEASSVDDKSKSCKGKSLV